MSTKVYGRYSTHNQDDFDSMNDRGQKVRSHNISCNGDKDCRSTKCVTRWSNPTSIDRNSWASMLTLFFWGHL